MANKINPGQMLIYLSFVLAIFSMVFAGIIGRTDVYILALGIGLFAYGLGADIPLVLLLASIAAFLGSYLPFGVTSATVIQGFEGFTDKKTEEEFEDENFADDKEENFADDKEENFADDKEENFADDKEENFEDDKENFEDENFEDMKKTEEEFEDENFEDGDDVEGFDNDNEENFEDE